MFGSADGGFCGRELGRGKEAGAHVIFESRKYGRPIMWIAPSCSRHNSEARMAGGHHGGHTMRVVQEAMAPFPECTCIGKDRRNERESAAYHSEWRRD